MSLLEELRNRVRDTPRRPEVLMIRDDQLEQLAQELNDLRMHPSFKDVEKVTPESAFGPMAAGCSASRFARSLTLLANERLIRLSSPYLR